MPPVLEVNPTHPLIAALHERLGQADPPLDQEAVADIAGSLLDLARVQELQAAERGAVDGAGSHRGFLASKWGKKSGERRAC